MPSWANNTFFKNFSKKTVAKPKIICNFVACKI